MAFLEGKMGYTVLFLSPTRGKAILGVWIGPRGKAVVLNKQ